MRTRRIMAGDKCFHWQAWTHLAKQIIPFDVSINLDLNYPKLISVIALLRISVWSLHLKNSSFWQTITVSRWMSSNYAHENQPHAEHGISASWYTPCSFYYIQFQAFSTFEHMHIGKSLPYTVSLHSPRSDLLSWWNTLALNGIKIKYKPGLYSNFLESSYAGRPSPEVDHAWHELLSNISIRVSGEELKTRNQTSVELPEGGGYMAWLGVSHQLHCIVSIQFSTNKTGSNGSTRKCYDSGIIENIIIPASRKKIDHIGIFTLVSHFIPRSQTLWLTQSRSLFRYSKISSYVPWRYNADDFWMGWERATYVEHQIDSSYVRRLGGTYGFSKRSGY